MTVNTDQFNFRVEQGSPRSFLVALYQADGVTLENLTGKIFELVVRSYTGSALLVKILSTDLSNPMGSLAVDTVASTVTMTLSAAATAAIVTGVGQVDAYATWALWEDEGLGDQVAKMTGLIYPRAVAQP